MINDIDYIRNDVADLKTQQAQLKQQLDAIQNDMWEIKSLLGILLEKASS